MRRRIMVMAAATALALAAGAAAAAPARASTASAPTEISVNHWVAGSLRSTAETDWYAFTLTGRAYVSVVLGNLPKNYNLSLYDAAGTRLARADHGGTRFESLDRMLPAGTYRVRVGSTSGSSATAYALIARSVKAPRVAALTARVRTETIAVVGEFVNASEQWALVGRASATFFRSDGRPLGTVGPKNLDVWFVVPPHGKVPYSLSLDATPPAGTTRATVVPEVSFVSARTPAALTTTATTRTRRTAKGIVFVDTTAVVHNGSTRSVRATFLDQAYDRRGILSAVGYVEPRLVGGGASGTFKSQLGGFAPTKMATMTLSAKAFETTNFLPTP